MTQQYISIICTHYILWYNKYLKSKDINKCSSKSNKS